jgi:hypothetical protein
MEALALPRRYRTILVPSSSFQLLTAPEQSRATMARLREHLLPGGALVMPFMRLWLEGDPLETDWRLSGEKARPEDGVLFRRWSRRRYDPMEECEHTQDRYEVERDGQVVAHEEHSRSPATRSYTLKQALALFEEAGFVSIEACREFTFEPARPEDPIVTLLGGRHG